MRYFMLLPLALLAACDGAAPAPDAAEPSPAAPETAAAEAGQPSPKIVMRVTEPAGEAEGSAETSGEQRSPASADDVQATLSKLSSSLSQESLAPNCFKIVTVECEVIDGRSVCVRTITIECF